MYIIIYHHIDLEATKEERAHFKIKSTLEEAIDYFYSVNKAHKPYIINLNTKMEV